MIMTPIYSAGEEPIENVTVERLAAQIRTQEKQVVLELKESTELPYLIRQIALPGDLVVCMGAGSITYWAATLPSQLDQLLSSTDDFAKEDLESFERDRHVGV